MAPVEIQLEGVSESDTWLLRRLPEAPPQGPQPTMDEQPVSDLERDMLSDAQIQARMDQHLAFEERLQKFHRENAQAQNERNIEWRNAILFHKIFLGASDGHYLVVMPARRALNDARKMLLRVLSLDADFDTMVALDRYGAEVLGLSSWPLPPASLASDFDDDENVVHVAIRRKIASKAPGYVDMRGIPEGAIVIHLPRPPTLAWFGPVPETITVSTPKKMDNDRRLDWVIARLSAMGIAVDDLEPTLANFLAFYRVLDDTFAVGMNRNARFDLGKLPALCPAALPRESGGPPGDHSEVWRLHLG